jgi:two-component system OmpR family sensor kinase/two-component system sensor histidine kinase BaeS
LQRPSTNTNTILFAEQQPAQSLIDALSEFRDELARPIFQAGGIGLLAAIIMAVIISRTIARPLQYIASATTAVAEGQYDQQVPVTGPPEIREVAASINHMSGEVRAAQQIQRDFLVNVSHDLKTPLTSIQGYAQAIIDGATADSVKAAAIIYDEAARLNRMVVELTDLARLENGQLSMQMVPLDLSQIVAAVGERMVIVAHKKGLTMNVDAPPMPEIQADGDRIAQVVTNLISNAIKYTPSGGSIRVSTQINNGGIELTVEDTGIGIPAADLPRVFERFYQVDKTRGPRRGTGLGLAIAQEIVHAHKGTISVASAGEGSTFRVWLPSPQLKTAKR